MNAFISEWNTIAATWTDWILSAGVQSTLILALVLCLWPLIRKRISAHLAYALFLLPLIPLAAPSPWSVSVEMNSTHGWAQYVPDVLMVQSSKISGGAKPSLHSNGDQRSALSSNSGTQLASTDGALNSPEASKNSPTFQAWIFLTWALTCLTLVAAFAHSQLRIAGQIRSAHPMPPADKQRIQRILRRLGARNTFLIRVSPKVSSPALWGIRRPWLLFPPQLVEQLDDQQLAWIVAHELAHHQRYDLVVGTVQRLIQIAWFFNPLVWWQGLRIDHLRECACDESAQARTQAQGKNCAEALLQVAAQSNRKYQPQFSLQTLHHQKQDMKQRILRLMNGDRQSRSTMKPAAASALILAACLSATSINVQNTPSPQSAIAKAHTWLLQQQDTDGSWAAGPDFKKPAGEFTTVGITGLVLLSLNQAEAGVADEPRKAAIQRGLEFLRKPLVDPIAYYGSKGVFQALASHAVATNAWLTVNPQVENEEWMATARKAVQILASSCNPYSAWGYYFEPNGDSNTINTSLALQATAAARDLGIEIPRVLFEGPQIYFQEALDKNTGRIGYSQYQANDVRIIEKKKSHPVSETELCTAMALVAQASWGMDVVDEKEMTQGLALVSTTRPAWNSDDSNVDYFYWYYGAQATHLVGGAFAEKWREDLHKVLLPRQLSGKDVEGSFPAVDAWSPAKATTHATVMATLALQAAN
jgi:beta-lactamase regulating signal transducer with metallopeptidase domain